MIFRKLVVGPFYTNSYIIGSKDSKEIVLIDPGFEPKKIIEEVEKIKTEKITILLTHGHIDHSIHLDEIKKHFPDSVLMYHEAEYNPRSKKATEKGIEFLVNLMENHDKGNQREKIEVDEKIIQFLQVYGLFTNIKAEGSKINLGEITLETLETPGHSPGSICFFSDDLKDIRGHIIDGIIFTGDLLLKRNVGEFMGPGADEQQLFESIKNKIMNNPTLTNHFKIFGGHYGDTTIAEERAYNPFTIFD